MLARRLIRTQTALACTGLGENYVTEIEKQVAKDLLGRHFLEPIGVIVAIVRLVHIHEAAVGLAESKNLLTVDVEVCTIVPKAGMRFVGRIEAVGDAGAIVRVAEHMHFMLPRSEMLPGKPYVVNDDVDVECDVVCFISADCEYAGRVKHFIV